MNTNKITVDYENQTNSIAQVIESIDVDLISSITESAKLILE